MPQGTHVKVISTEPIYHDQTGTVECETRDHWILVLIGCKLRSFRESELVRVTQ